MKRRGERDCIVIGIGGPSRSGKSTFAKKLKDKLQCQIDLKNKVEIIHQDSDEFGKDILDPSFPKVMIKGKEYVDWETPASQNYDRLILEIKKMKENNRVVIVEGYLIFSNVEVLKLFDVRVFVTLSDNKIEERRLEDKRYESNPLWDPILGDPDMIKHVIKSSRMYNLYREESEGTEESFVEKIRNIDEHEESHFVFSGDDFFKDTDVDLVVSFISKLQV